MHKTYNPKKAIQQQIQAIKSTPSQRRKVPRFRYFFPKRALKRAPSFFKEHLAFDLKKMESKRSSTSQKDKTFYNKLIVYSLLKSINKDSKEQASKPLSCSVRLRKKLSKRNFKRRLSFKRYFGKLYGGLPNKTLKKFFDHRLNKFNKIPSNILFDLRLEAFLVHVGFFRSFKSARQHIKHGHIFVNRKANRYKDYVVKPFDVITVPSYKTFKLDDPLNFTSIKPSVYFLSPRLKYLESSKNFRSIQTFFFCNSKQPLLLRTHVPLRPSYRVIPKNYYTQRFYRRKKFYNPLSTQKTHLFQGLTLNYLTNNSVFVGNYSKENFSYNPLVLREVKENVTMVLKDYFLNK